jgi:hypothetical protein
VSQDEQERDVGYLFMESRYGVYAEGSRHGFEPGNEANCRIMMDNPTKPSATDSSTGKGRSRRRMGECHDQEWRNAEGHIQSNPQSAGQA